MNAAAVSVALLRLRRRSGLSQRVVAQRMATTQSVISRAERDWTRMPTLDFVDRYARACGQPLTLVLGAPKATESRAVIRERVRAAGGRVGFNPYDRDPGPAEVRSLAQDGLTREHFEST